MNICQIITVFCVCIDKKKSSAGTQTEPVPTVIDRMPLAVLADTQTPVAANSVLSGHSAVDPCASEVAFLSCLFWLEYSLHTRPNP